MAYKTNTGKKTKDKIFLPAEADVCQTKLAEKYGFVSEYTSTCSNREAESTDYTELQSSKNFESRVFSTSSALRTNSKYTDCNTFMDYDRVHMSDIFDPGVGSIKNYGTGVRPMIQIDLTKAKAYYAGTVKLTGKYGCYYKRKVSEVSYKKKKSIAVSSTSKSSSMTSGNTKNFIHFPAYGQIVKKGGITYFIDERNWEKDEAYDELPYDYEHFLAYVKKIPNKSTITIPETITVGGVKCTVVAILDKAAYKNTKLKKITLPYKLLSIRKYAFAGCKSLSKIVCNKKQQLPPLVDIYKKAFLNCKSLPKKLKTTPKK